MRDDVAHHTRTCPDCQRTFELTPGELAFFEALAAGLEGEWKLPRRCTDCRAARRRAQESVQADDPDVWLTCIECGDGFIFGGRDRDDFARQGWRRPRRCRPCRQGSRLHAR